MSKPPYRALRIILGIFSLIAAVAGLVAIFGSKSLMTAIFLGPPAAEVSTLLLFMLKEGGGFLLMFSLLLFFAARDPARNAAIINALIVGLSIAAITPLVSLYALDIGRLYPGYMIWGRSILRLLFAALLFSLRPGTVAEQP